MIMSIRKLSFGTPEKHVPSNFCPDFCTKVDICGKGNKNGNFDISAVTFRTTQRGCVVELPFALYSDLYGHREFIRGCVNSGFSGMLWAPEVRHAKSAEDLIRRLQTAVFSAQCMFNGWYCTEAPWVTFGCEDKVRELFALRESLVPMLRRAYDLYREDGTPPVRALVCDYTDDKRTWGIDDEYIFCGELIVAPMVEGEKSRKVYLPEGKWVDFFTNEPVDAGEFTYTEDNIPVYRKVA